MTLPLDDGWRRRVLVDMLRIASPTGRTGQVMRYIGEQVEKLGLSFELNRRGTMTIRLREGEGPTQGVVVHADTIGCMVGSFKPNGRLSLVSAPRPAPR